MNQILRSNKATEGAEAAEAKVFVYHLDHADKIVSVDDAWLQFAADNGAPELNRNNVENQSIWSFISDPDTQLIYRLLFDAVRTRLQPVTITFRCDSPTLRRYMSLTCFPLPKHGIELQSSIVREETRAYVPMLDSKIQRSDAVVTICAWCKQWRVDELDWREIEEAVSALEFFSESLLPSVSHGMCATCHVAKLREIRSGVSVGARCG